MPAQWIRWDSAYFRNAKARALGKDGRSLHLAATCWVFDNETDGKIPTAILPLLCAEAEVKPSIVKTMIACDVFHVCDGGWMLHDYLEHNPSKAERQAERDKWKRQKRGQRAVSTVDTEVDTGVDPPQSPQHDDDETRRDVDETDDYISDNSDSLTTPGMSSSSADSILNATAMVLAQRATGRTGTVQSYANGIASRMKRERIDDIAICVAEGWTIDESIKFLIDGKVPSGVVPPVHPNRREHRDPACKVCDFDGMFRNDENRLQKCDCLRAEPYMAEIIHLRQETA